VRTAEEVVKQQKGTGVGKRSPLKLSARFEPKSTTIGTRKRSPSFPPGGLPPHLGFQQVRNSAYATGSTASTAPKCRRNLSAALLLGVVQEQRNQEPHKCKDQHDNPHSLQYVRNFYFRVPAALAATMLAVRVSTSFFIKPASNVKTGIASGFCWPICSIRMLSNWIKAIISSSSRVSEYLKSATASSPARVVHEHSR